MADNDNTFPTEPNFDGVLKFADKAPSLGKWLAKLQDWCREAITKYTAERARVDQLEHELIESADMKQTHERLLEDLADVPRGIRTLDEVLREYD